MIYLAAYLVALALVLAFNYGAHRNDSERCERHQEQTEVTR